MFDFWRDSIYNRGQTVYFKGAEAVIACFYMEQSGIAVERVRFPHLRDEVLALASADNVIKVVSDEAAKFGVSPGLPVVTARSICSGLIVMPYDEAAYRDCASAVWDMIALETSLVEPVSPELVFAEFDDLDVVERVQHLAYLISKHSGLTCAVGIGSSKIVARHAATHSKGELSVVEFGHEALSLANVPLADLSHIDRKLRQRAERLGLRTLGDILRVPPDELQRQFKQSSLRLGQLAVGIDGDHVRATWPPKSVEHEIEFDEEVSDQKTLQSALQIATAKIASILQLDREYCRQIFLTVEMEDRSVVAKAESLKHPTHHPIVLLGAAARLFERCRVDKPVISIHVRATKIDFGESQQLSLLDNKLANLESALSYLRSMFGPGAVVTGELLGHAQRIHLWTYSLSKLYKESVEVATDRRGSPVRYYRPRKDQNYNVTSINNYWQETDWDRGLLVDKTCYRVLADPTGGLYQIEQLGIGWQLSGMAD